MKKLIPASIVLCAFVTVPFTAHAEARMNKDQLIAWATGKQACGEDRPVADVYYTQDTGNEVRIECGEATGFVPLAGAAGLGGGAAAAGLGLAAIAAAGGGGSTPDTQ